MSGEICTDNRFEVIAAYKKMLVERTNIETLHDEMAIIDNILYRFWQMRWLPPIPHGRLIDADAYESLLRGLGDRNYRREKGTICDAIKFLHPHYAPTIIPAEEGE